MTVWGVYCPAHKHWLVYASSTGTTWTDDREAAKMFTTKPKATAAMKQATWLDHNPTIWAMPATEATP